MRIRPLVLSLALVGSAVLAAPAAPAREKGPLAPIEAGLDAYRTGGAEAAVRGWLHGGPLESDTQALAQANMLKAVEAFYGPYRSYEVVAGREVGESTRFVFTVMSYEKGPLFGRFVVFRQGESWTIVQFQVHTDPDEVWPEALIAP